MEITLRRAHALQQEIKARIDALSESAVGIVTIDDYSPVETQIEDARQTVSANLDAALKLIEVLYQIREDVARQNQEQGISRLLAEAEMISKQIKAMEKSIPYQRGSSPVGMIKSADQIQKMLDKVNADSAIGRYASPVETQVLTPVQVAEIESGIARLKKLRANRNDALLEKNISTKITLSSDHVALLERQRLI
jgi:hypothetical protein